MSNSLERIDLSPHVGSNLPSYQYKAGTSSVRVKNAGNHGHVVRVTCQSTARARQLRQNN